MPTLASTEAIDIAELTQAVDDARDAAAPYKLLPFSRMLLNLQLAYSSPAPLMNWPVGHNPPGDGPETDHVTNVAT